MPDLTTSYLLDRLAQLALDADPETAKNLAALQGKRLRLVCTAPPIDLVLGFFADGVKLQPEPTEGTANPPSHALVRGSAIDLWQLVSGGDVGKLQLEGDLALLQQFAEAVKGYKPNPPPLPPLPGALANNPQAAALAGDMQQLLHKTMGNVAEGVSLLGAAFGATNRQARQQFEQQFASEDEFEALLNSLHQMRLQVDRLQARIETLEAS